ncbi:MAG: MBL fold metallo-hydrolase [Deltaproteobacteria bacterium]|nr:MBL fold metallo-hydrolase [Deltaproteobacteria bacterium]
MEILFLGTGSAWSLPEHSCRCAICLEMRRRGEERARTSFLVESDETLLVDCGPDIQRQMKAYDVGRPDAVLITHEHADHFLGVDDLLAFRRSVPRDAWVPIPMYATATCWKAIDMRFGYLVGSLLEKREAVPGNPLEGLALRVTPFKTFHGPTAAGSVGYVIEENRGNSSRKLVYTSDFLRVDAEPPLLLDPDVLIIQSHWLNEPMNNRPYHMSFQRAIDYIRRWKPMKGAYLVHISAGDQVVGDPANNALNKSEPLSPLLSPLTGEPYPVPTCQAEWEAVIDRIRRELDLPPVVVAKDGLRVRV